MLEQLGILVVQRGAGAEGDEVGHPAHEPEPAAQGRGPMQAFLPRRGLPPAPGQVPRQQEEEDDGEEEGHQEGRPLPEAVEEGAAHQEAGHLAQAP